MKAKKNFKKAQNGMMLNPSASLTRPVSNNFGQTDGLSQFMGSPGGQMATQGASMVGNMILPGLGTAIAAAPQIYAAIQGAKAQREATTRARDLQAMMPSMTSQEDYYNYYQQVAQSTNEARQQNQLDQTLAAGAKTLQGAGTRGVLGGVQGAVGAAAQSKFDIGQERAQQLLGAQEKLIGAKQQDREMIQSQIGRAEQAATAGLQTQLSGLQGAADVLGAGALMYAKEGGKIKKTPGEFSHKTNPIDVVKDGVKIAEMTGGEYIFNPKQMAAIKSLVGTEDKSKLHSYMKSIIRKFEKRAAK
jgi:hypothetical protein